MEIRENREQVIGTFRDALARDKTRTQVFDISELGLVEMTRKRIGEGLLESFSTLCPECEGRGLLLDRDLLDLSRLAGPLDRGRGWLPSGSRSDSVVTPMYAVIKTGGKQYRVEEGQRLDVEKLAR